jgi:hypothetical protein
VLTNKCQAKFMNRIIGQRLIVRRIFSSFCRPNTWSAAGSNIGFRSLTSISGTVVAGSSDVRPSNTLYDQQVAIEEQQFADAMKNYNESVENLFKMGRGTGLKNVQSALLKWYEPFQREIYKEIACIESGVYGIDRKVKN